MSLQDIRQHEHTDAALPVLNQDSFPRVLKLNNNSHSAVSHNLQSLLDHTYRSAPSHLRHLKTDLLSVFAHVDKRQDFHVADY